MTVAPDLSLLLRDAIEIPEHVQASDFVLQLVAGVSAAEQTLDEYVVTEKIAETFDEALGLIRSAIRTSSSRGAFIHGSFGSGKSHFMAVLHLLLTGNAHARALPGLQADVAKYQDVLSKNFLAVDYHLLGKNSMEEAIFSGYLQRIRELHPDAQLPVFHNSDAIIADAENLRARIGDEAFLAGLGGGESASKWGKRAVGYTLTSYLAAINQPADHEDRQRVVRALVAAYFQASVASGEWLEMSQGLRAMTEHAKSLGYDGIVLFLDELVLWLGQHLGDMTFIQTETSKVAKLVESEMGQLPIPLVSFVARQRELKDFVGEGALGAQQVSLGQSFQWWEDRFNRLDLAATDLPEIVNRRLLHPTSELGAASLAAGAALVKSSNAWSHLLEDEAHSSEIDFHKVYPFSPALVDAMVALSSLMQRERTALKIMSELLSNGRDELTVRDVIPVGDLFDVVVLGDTPPLSDVMKQHFNNAKDFYLGRVRPYLLGKYSLTEATAKNLPRDHPFLTEDRLVKTLLIAQIAPEATSLKNLTASKLAALNYGTVKSFIPNAEAQQVLTWVRHWSTQFPEVEIGTGTDPVLGIHLTGVDFGSVLDRVKNIDDTATRRQLIKKLLLEEFGLTEPDGLLPDIEYAHTWRGTKRKADLVFGNLRDEKELSDQALIAAPDRWRLAIDYPFDTGDGSPNDDAVRLNQLRDDKGFDTNTIGWAPHHLSTARMDDVGKLVLLDYVLTGSRFTDNSDHLPVQDREPARMQLDNQRKNLTEQVKAALRQAYNVATGDETNIGTPVDPANTFVALAPGVRINTPQATTLRAGLDDVLDQALDQQYPDHPRFDPAVPEVTRRQLQEFLDLLHRAASSGGRVEGIERSKASAYRRIASAMRTGVMHENHFTFSAQDFAWLSLFTRWSAATDNEITVADLRANLAPYGMPKDMEDLLILAWAIVDNRQLSLHHSAVSDPKIGELRDDMILRPAVLPDQDLWDAAVARGSKLFGIPAEHHRNVSSVDRLAGTLAGKARDAQGSARELVSLLEQHGDTLGLVGRVDGRLATARRALELVDLLTRTDDATETVNAFGGFALPPEPEALATSLATAAAVVGKLRGAAWNLIDGAARTDAPEDIAIIDRLRTVAAREELHDQLGKALDDAGIEATTALQARANANRVTMQSSASASQVGAAAATMPVRTAEPLTDPDAVSLVIDGEPQWTEIISTLRKAYRNPVPGKRFRVTGRWE